MQNMDPKCLTDEAMHAAPPASILMAVWNEEPMHLRKAIESIVAQTSPDFEFVIVDDGSDRTDTTAGLDEWATRDARIRLWRQPHSGLTKALNNGLARCRGAIICRQDADDWSAVTRLEKQAAALEADSSISVVGSNVEFHREDGRPLWVARFPISRDEIAAAFPVKNPFLHGATCFRRRDAERVGFYREEFECAQDYDLFWRLCDRWGGMNLNEVLYHYRYRIGSISQRKAREMARDRLMVRVMARMRQTGQTEDFARASVFVERQVDLNAAAGSWLGRRGDCLMLAGAYGHALRAFVGAVVSRPLDWRGWLKLARFIVFLVAPGVTKHLFSGGAERVSENETGSWS